MKNGKQLTEYQELCRNTTILFFQGTIGLIAIFLPFVAISNLILEPMAIVGTVVFFAMTGIWTIKMIPVWVDVYINED